MRNRRLLTLAVLAVALGLAAFAQAETAVVTVTTDVGGTFAVNYQLNAGTSLGTASSSLGASDFTLRSLLGTGDVTVDTGAQVEFPLAGTLTQTGQSDVVAGFAGGIHKLEFDALTNSYNVALSQPLAYAETAGEQLLIKDAAVLLKIGTTGSEALQSQFTTAGIDWLSGAPTYAGNTLMVSGTWSTTGQGAVTAYTFGIDGFSVVPDNGSGGYTGPTLDSGSFGTPVDAVVVKTVTSTSTDVRVEAGNVTLGADFTGTTTTSLTIDAADGENAGAVLGANQSISTLTINNKAGIDTVNVNASKLSVYGDGVIDMPTLADNLKAMLGTAADGLYSSQVDLANEVLVITIEGTDHVAVKATLLGDINLDGTVDNADYNVMAQNWLSAKTQWTEGEIAGSDNFVDNADYNVLAQNWLLSFTPTGGAAPAPEPATLALLAIGGLAVIRRRRRS